MEVMHHPCLNREYSPLYQYLLERMKSQKKVHKSSTLRLANKCKNWKIIACRL